MFRPLMVFIASSNKDCVKEFEITRVFTNEYFVEEFEIIMGLYIIKIDCYSYTVGLNLRQLSL